MKCLSLEPGFGREDDPITTGEAVYTNRAGLIIAAPFFIQLFGRLGYLDGGQFRNDDLAGRAIHLMEFIATGHIHLEGHQLVLHKILAGIPVESPIAPISELSDEETTTVESMLQGLIQTWGALGSTTTGGLRESFLNREGRLLSQEGGWELTVEGKAYDVMIDRLPWDIGIIKLPWMKTILEAHWR